MGAGSPRRRKARDEDMGIICPADVDDKLPAQAFFKTPWRALPKTGVVVLLCILDARIYSEFTKSGVFPGLI